MDQSSIEMIFTELITLALYLTLPILIITFIAAIFIGIIQSMMQVQEQTLSFAPKLIIVAILLLIMSTAMFSKITESFTDILKFAPSMF